MGESRKNEQGFSMVEMLVVMLILGVVTIATTSITVATMRSTTLNTGIRENLDVTRIAMERVRDTVRGAFAICDDSTAATAHVWTDADGDMIIDSDEDFYFGFDAAGSTLQRWDDPAPAAARVTVIDGVIVAGSNFTYYGPGGGTPVAPVVDCSSGDPTGLEEVPVLELTVQVDSHPDSDADPETLQTSVRLRNATVAALSGGSTDNPPAVAWASPVEGAEIVSGTTVTLRATAADDSEVVSVAFAVDGTQLAVDSVGFDGWSTTWDTSGQPEGSRTLRATATDDAGKTRSVDINVSILAAGSPGVDAPPTVTMSSPADGQTVGGTQTLVAHASDDFGVAQVAFQIDGVTVATDTDPAGGWTASWNSASVSDGDHTITAVAADSAGQTGVDAIVVMVNNTSPRVSIGDLDGRAASLGANWIATAARVFVKDQTGNPIVGASVSYRFEDQLSTCTTQADGSCPEISRNMKKTDAEATFVVERITRGGYVYAASDNDDPDGDSDGTTLVIPRP